MRSIDFDKMKVGSMLISRHPFVIQSVDLQLLEEFQNLYNIKNFTDVPFDRLLDVAIPELRTAFVQLQERMEKLDSTPYHFNYQVNEDNYLRAVRATPLYTSRDDLNGFQVTIATLSNDIFNNHNSIITKTDSSLSSNPSFLNVLESEPNWLNFTDIQRDEYILRNQFKLKAAIKNANLGLFEWNVSKNEITVSENILKFFGLEKKYTENDIIDAAVIFNKIHPEDLDFIQEKFHSAHSKTDDYSYTYRVINEDQSLRWLTVTSLKLPTNQNMEVIIVGVISDITDFKVQQEKLVKLNEEYINITDFVPHVVWTLSEQGKLLFANKRFYETFENASIEKWFDNTHPDDHELLKNELKMALAEKRDYDCEFRYFHKSSNTYRWARGRGIRVNTSKGVIYYGTTTDIQDIKDLEERYLLAKLQAESASNAKSTFLANMSHEIRTPLSVIMGYTELLKDFIVNPDTLEFLEIISKNGKNLTHIIDDVLDISKIEAGMMTTEKINLNLFEEIKNSVDLFRIQAERKGLSLSLTCPDEIAKLEVISDPTRFRQILVNLIGNAIKFTQKGSVKVVVTGENLRTSLPTFEIKVIDTGIGISPDSAKNIFDPFMQADSSTTRNFGGTGLGLSISKRLAELLNGDLTYSPNPDQGSTFSFRFTSEVPIINNVIPISASKQKHKFSSEELKGYKILIAEDTEDTQVLIKYLLTKMGADVVIVENGKKVLEVLEKETFDVILLDIQMPILDGYATMAELKKRNYQGPVIALTAHALKEDELKSLRAGFKQHLTKPVSTADLLSCIKTHCPRPT